MGENFPANKSFTNVDLRRHENYMRQAYSDGRLIMAALFANGTGIITLVESESEHEVRKFVNNNPDIVDKRIQARIKMCTPIFWKNFSLDK